MGFGKSKSPSISIPEYQKPSPAVYDAFGLRTDPSGNGYNLTMSGQQAADYSTAQKIRAELLEGLGLSGPSGGAKQFGDLITRESLRTAQPTLENALIQRGLGGSSIYKEALTDLISKASTQGTLASGDYLRANLNSLAGDYFNPIYSLGQNLLQLAGNKSAQDQQLAQSLYQMQLPYLAQVMTPGDSGLGGAINGAITGLMMSGGNPIGAIVGGGAGFASSRSGATSQPYMLSDYYAKNNSNNALLSLLSGMGGGAGGSAAKVF